MSSAFALLSKKWKISFFSIEGMNKGKIFDDQWLSSFSFSYLIAFLKLSFLSFFNFKLSYLFCRSWLRLAKFYNQSLKFTLLIAYCSCNFVTKSLRFSDAEVQMLKEFSKCMIILPSKKTDKQPDQLTDRPQKIH